MTKAGTFEKFDEEASFYFTETRDTLKSYLFNLFNRPQNSCNIQATLRPYILPRQSVNDKKNCLQQISGQLYQRVRQIAKDFQKKISHTRKCSPRFYQRVENRSNSYINQLPLENWRTEGSDNQRQSTHLRRSIIRAVGTSVHTTDGPVN